MAEHRIRHRADSQHILLKCIKKYLSFQEERNHKFPAFTHRFILCFILAILHHVTVKQESLLAFKEILV